MNLPRISIVTPSFNSGAFLGQAIQSVEQQRGVEVEHIVTDGGSTDNTLQVLQSHDNLRWISEADRGQSDAINKGFRKAIGDLVGWLNADDYYLPGGLAALAQAALEHPECDVFYGDSVFVNEQGSIVRSKVEHDFDEKVLLHFGCYIPSTTTLVRRRVLDGGYLLDCDYRVCMDFEYFLRLAHAGFRFHYVPRFVAAFRWHENNISLHQAVRRRQERLQVQRSYAGQNLSETHLDFLSNVYRAKRLLRKLAGGNLVREWRLRQMSGRDTLWMEHTEGAATCASLACL